MHTYSNRCAVKRRPPLTVQQVTRLEGLVNTTTAKDSDRIAAGAFLVMVYGRLRFSDMQRSSGFVIDSVVHEGVLPSATSKGELKELRLQFPLSARCVLYRWQSL